MTSESSRTIQEETCSERQRTTCDEPVLNEAEVQRRVTCGELQRTIRDGIAEVLYSGDLDVALLRADKVLRYLHLQGVVIKTGGEWCIQHGYPLPCYKCGAKYGQAAVEPLIKERAAVAGYESTCTSCGGSGHISDTPTNITVDFGAYCPHCQKPLKIGVKK